MQRLWHHSVVRIFLHSFPGVCVGLRPLANIWNPFGVLFCKNCSGKISVMHPILDPGKSKGLNLGLACNRVF